MKLEADILKCFRAGVLAIDISGKVVFRNEIALKILNHKPLQIGDNLRGMSGENPFFRMLVEALDLQYLPSRMEAILPGREGMHRSVGFTLAELKEENRRTGICAFFKDLTHVEMAEENRDLDARLRLLGQMAAGLAHEIRNPIASIGVHCGLLRSRYQGDPKILSSISHMENEIGKVEDIIRECLNFVRPADLKPKTASVKAILERLAAEADKRFEGVEIRFHSPDEGDIEAEVDEMLLEQALGNIISNAAQACDPGGKVVISARVAHGYWDLDPEAREPMLSDGSGEREDFLSISIKDTGKGIPDDIREKIFVPFFTTKKGGTGIGLSIVQKIVYAHKGVLDILSEPGKGTEFIIKIPLRFSNVR
jgi:signal transduction histidine kinase